MGFEVKTEHGLGGSSVKIGKYSSGGCNWPSSWGFFEGGPKVITLCEVNQVFFYCSLALFHANCFKSKYTIEIYFCFLCRFTRIPIIYGLRNDISHNFYSINSQF